MKNPLNILFSPKEASFIGWFMLIFLGSAGVLALFGLLPSEFTEQSNGQTLSDRIAGGVLGTNTESNTQTDNSLGLPFSESALGILNSTGSRPNTQVNNQITTSTQKTAVGLPTRLIIPSIAVDTKVYIPRSTATAVLDADLQKGPVYYPGSGTINTGNMFIFGHSTGHAVVINKAYKVFNELKNLTSGDIIYVESEGKRFTYRVRSVDKVDKDETLVTFDTKAHLLTLSTCNSFGSKSDRFVVVAEFVN
jgi:LPXTG-site transpeptidase (sortase) family protein